MKIGILGGTFDPIHLAHLRVAEEVREACGLERVLFIPAAHPPHKEQSGSIPFSHRLAMVEAAVCDNPAFAVSDIEARRPGKSYSVQTLEILGKERPADEFYFIIGLDSFRDLASWRDYARLFELAHLVVAARPGVFPGDPRELLPVAIKERFCYNDASRTLRHHGGNSVFFVEETRLDISSTRIRQLVAAGRSIRYLVPPTVVDYISSHGLYRRPER